MAAREGRGIAVVVEHGAGAPSHPTSSPGVLTVRRRAAAGNYAELVDENEEEERNQQNTGRTLPHNSADLDREGDCASRIRARIQDAGHRTKNSVSKLKRSIPEPIKSYCVPSKNTDEFLRFLFIRIPILNWIWSYKPKQIVGDLLAGVVIGFAHIPESLGLATLAGVPSILGLYASLIPVLVYAFLGTCSHLSVGTFALIALTSGETVEVFTTRAEAVGRCTRNSTAVTAQMLSCDDISVNTALTLSLSSGVFLVGLGILQLSFIDVFLSNAMKSGFTTAAAIATLITQLQFVLGFQRQDIRIGSSVFILPELIISYFRLTVEERVNVASLVIGLLVFFFLILIRVCNIFLKKKFERFPLQIPGPPLALIITTVISSQAGFQELFGISTASSFAVTRLDVIRLPTGANLTLPPFTGDRIDPKLMRDGTFMLEAFALAMLIYVLSISSVQLVAEKTGDIIHTNQEFLAFGFMNLLGSLFGAIPTSGNFSRTLLQLSFGGSTQLVSIISFIVVFVVALFASELFNALPLATLSAVIIVGLEPILLQFVDLKKYWRLNKWDLITWVITFLSTVIINVKIGLLIGLIMSLLTIVVRTVLPRSSILGKASHWNAQSWKYDQVDAVEGVLIYRFQAPLHFANVAVFKSRIELASGVQLVKRRPSPRESDGFLPRLFRGEYKCCREGCCDCCNKDSSSHGDEQSNHYSEADGHGGSDIYLPFPDISEDTSVSVNAVLKDQAKKPHSSPSRSFSHAVHRLTGGLGHRRRGYSLNTGTGSESLLQHQEADADIASDGNSAKGNVSTSSGSTSGQTTTDSSNSDYTAVVTVLAEVQGQETFPVAAVGSETRVPHFAPTAESHVAVPDVHTAPNEDIDSSREYYNLSDVVQRRPKPPKLTVTADGGSSDYYNLIYYPPKGETATGEQAKSGTGTGTSSRHMQQDTETRLKKHEIRRKLVHGEEIAEESDYAGLTKSFWHQLRTAERNQYHTIILDCLPIVFIDSAGAQTLHQMIKDFSALGIEFLMAAPTMSFVSNFEKLVCCRECAQHFMFPSIESAVLYAVSTERQEQPRSKHILSQHQEVDVSMLGYLEKRTRRVTHGRRIFGQKYTPEAEVHTDDGVVRRQSKVKNVTVQEGEKDANAGLLTKTV